MKKPTFLLKPCAFKSNKLYAIIPDDGNGDGTVSFYVGNGTRVNPQGLIEDVATDTPRINHLGLPGLLAEASRTNQALNSEAVASWVTVNATIANNDTIAPDGNKTADRITDGTGTNLVARQDTTVSDATAIHAMSVFIKFGDRSQVSISGSSPNQSGSILLCNDDGTMSISVDATSSIGEYGSDYYGDGWYRFWFIYDMLNTDTVLRFAVRPSPGSGDSYGYCWAWGMQVEEGYFPTSYIPTAGSTVARVYDQITVASMETNGLLNIDNATVFFDFKMPYHQGSGAGAKIGIGTTNGQIYVNATTGSYGYGNVLVQSTDTTYDTTALTRERNKIAFNITPTNVDVWINGVKADTTSKDFQFTNDNLRIIGNGGIITVYEISTFEGNLSDTELKSLTQ